MKRSILIMLTVVPNMVFAAGITNLIDAASKIITDILIPMAFALCLLYFFWGVAKYIRAGAGGEKAAEDGKRVMVWGIVGLFIATSIWGIISFIQGELMIEPITNVQKDTVESVYSVFNPNNKFVE